MNSKSTWFLMALAAGLFAFIFFYERHIGGDHQPEGPRPVLPGLEASSVRRLEFTKGPDLLRVERQPEGWKMTSPVAYPADQFSIQRFIEFFGEMKGLAVIPEGEMAKQSNGLAAYGLNPPQATLTVYVAEEPIEIRIGSKSPVGDRLYIQLGGSADVLVVDSALQEQLPRGPGDWRDPALLSLNGIAFNRMEVRAPSRGFEVQQEGPPNGWQITKPPPVKRADDAKIEHLIQQMKGWRVMDFVSDNPAADLEQYGLQTPAAEVAFGQGTNDLAVVQFGKNPTNMPHLVYARRMSHTNIVLVPKEALDLVLTPFSEFRDRRLAAVKPDLVEQIVVRAEDNFVLRRQPDQGWRVVDPLNFQADTMLVHQLLASIGQLEIVEFVKDVVTDFAAYGLANPSLEYTLRGGGTNGAASTNEPLAAISIGNPYQADKVYLRRADESSVYAAPLGDVLRLPRSMFQVRDRRVWNFNSTNVVAVTIQQHGQTRKLVRNAQGEWAFAPGSQGIINPFSLEETLFRLGQLKAESWVAQGEEKLALHGFKEGGHKITLELKSGETARTLTLEFGRESPQRRPYAVVSLDGQPVIFEFPVNLYADVWRDLSLPPAP